MKLLVLHTAFLLVLTYPSAAAEPPQNVSGDLHSPLNLTTKLSPNDVKEVSWNREINGTENRIVRIKNGNFVDDHEGYGQFFNGTVLEINNLTVKDQGLYIAEVTFLNNTMETQKFNVTVRDNKVTRSHLRLLYFLGTAVVVAFVVILLGIYICRKCRRRASYRTGEDGKEETEMEERHKKDEDENERLMETSGNPDEQVQNQELKEREYDVHQNGDINNQDEGQADEGENKEKEQKNKDEHQNEDNLKHPVPETASHKVWTYVVYENEVKKYKKKDEHWNKEENREIIFQYTSDLDDMEEHKKKPDHANDEGRPLVEETEATTVSKIAKTILTDREQPY